MSKTEAVEAIEVAENSNTEKLEQIIKILEPYKSVNFKEIDDDGTFIIKVIRYRSFENCSSRAQGDLIRSFKNMTFSVGYNNVFRHLSKYAASALITLAKDCPDTDFYIII